MDDVQPLGWIWWTSRVWFMTWPWYAKHKRVSQVSCGQPVECSYLCGVVATREGQGPKRTHAHTHHTNIQDSHSHSIYWIGQVRAWVGACVRACVPSTFQLHFLNGTCRITSTGNRNSCRNERQDRQTERERLVCRISSAILPSSNYTANWQLRICSSLRSAVCSGAEPSHRLRLRR
jgi:hypothetical protein